MKTEPYAGMAYFYDKILEHVDYLTWYQYLKSIMMQYTEKQNEILEIGCGTGRFGALFSKDNYKITGIDLSKEMLTIAQKRAHHNFSIQQGDIRTFKLEKKFNYIFCVHDTMNYLLTTKDLNLALQNVKKHMDEESIFMFDITTEYNVKKYFENKVDFYKIKGTEISWGNTYNYFKKVITSNLKFTFPDGSSTSEKHIQKIHSIKKIKRILKKNGFELLDVFGDYSFSPVSADTVMINFITKKAK